MLSPLSGTEIGFSAGHSEGWFFLIGKEFPGAQGGFALIPEQTIHKSFTGRLEGVFTDGGRYTAIQRIFPEPLPFRKLKITLRNTGCFEKLNLRLVDETGQYHQFPVPLALDRESFQTVTCVPPSRSEISWGGANDRHWHGRLRGLALMAEGKYLPQECGKGTLHFSSITVIP